jgi:hypothetical protein
LGWMGFFTSFVIGFLGIARRERGKDLGGF